MGRWLIDSLRSRMSDGKFMRPQADTVPCKAITVILIVLSATEIQYANSTCDTQPLTLSYRPRYPCYDMSSRQEFAEEDEKDCAVGGPLHATPAIAQPSPALQKARTVTRSKDPMQLFWTRYASQGWKAFSTPVGLSVRASSLISTCFSVDCTYAKQ